MQALVSPFVDGVSGGHKPAPPPSEPRRNRRTNKATIAGVEATTWSVRTNARVSLVAPTVSPLRREQRRRGVKLAARPAAQ
jgi:hypothetical protein